MKKELENIINESEKEEKPAEEIQIDEKNETFIEGTMNNKIKDSEYITSIKDNENQLKLLGKIFLDIKKKGKYIELFNNTKMEALGISPHITFIHSYSDDKERHYNPSKFIGFRYYENGPKQEGKFFTLIKINNYKYFILEKNEKLEDINGALFYDENLNCFDIIQKIVFEKHKNGIIGSNGDLFPELIGYCYALASLKIISNFKLMEPLVSDLNLENCIIDNIPKIIKDDFIYIEPFIYDGHVSLIISFKAKDNHRYNIILDMSSYHFNTDYPNYIFLPKTLKTKNIIFPKFPIQAYSSCCIWFYGEIQCLLTIKKYSDYVLFFNSLKNYGIDFYIDVINYLSKNLDGIECLIKKENEQLNAKEIDLNRLIVLGDKGYYSIHKDIIFSKFLDIDKFLKNLGRFLFAYDYGFLIKYQKLIMNVYEFKNKLLFNYKYYDLLPQNKMISNGKNFIDNAIKRIDQFQKLFKDKYKDAFNFKNKLSFQRNVDNTSNEISDNIPLKKEREERILNSMGFDFFYDNMLENYSDIKKNIVAILRLFSENTISNEIKSLDDICFVVMNK